MKIDTILFDLDGTLLPMDQDIFIKAYFKKISSALYKHGYDPSQLINAIWKGTSAMISNDGTKSNEQVFWDTVSSIYGEKILKDKTFFDDFYLNEFDSIKEVTSFNPLASKTVKALINSGYTVALATNPIFPKTATQKRIQWAGLKLSDFAVYTTYENINFSKPNLKYYQAVASRLNVKPQQCLMVGNDVDDDMVAQNLGMNVFLLTDCLINKSNSDISQYPNGDFNALDKYIQTI